MTYCYPPEVESEALARLFAVRGYGIMAFI